jgi:tetratricopeptide (TPR) repeat protein
MARTRNELLAGVIAETGWSQTQLAAHLVRVAAESGADELLAVSRSHVAMWISGVRPERRARLILCETLSRRLGRVVTLGQIGLEPTSSTPPTRPLWDVSTVAALVDLGDQDMDMKRRRVLAASAYSVAGAVLPPDSWWDLTREAARTRASVSRFTVTPAHVESVREATRFFSRQDQRLGGRASRGALTAFLATDVATYLAARFPNEAVRRTLFAAAGELVYLAGWMAFDSGDHSSAQHRFALALKLAAEADDAPLAGHIMRAAAHQAVDLGHPRVAVEFAEGSLTRRRYALASPREKALLGVVHARALAVARRKNDALAALRHAEDDLRSASPGDDEPERVFFFAEASLAHETAATLRDLGDLKGAEAQFKRSVRTRTLPLALRTHAVTLGYLGAVQARQGKVDAACETWSRALDSMDGIQSGRARDAVVQMRRSLSPVLRRGGGPARELDQRAKDVLRGIG